MAFNDLDRKRVEKQVDTFIESRRPPVELRDQLDLAYRLDGQTIDIFEKRRSLRGHPVETPVARLRFVKSRKAWKLYWMRADLKWHGYEPFPESPSLEVLLREIDEDPNACFFG